MAALSKVRPKQHIFGLLKPEGKEQVGEETRAISLLFSDVAVVGTYHPQGGFLPESLTLKVQSHGVR